MSTDADWATHKDDVTFIEPPVAEQEVIEHVNHPKHYNMYKGVEIIDLVEQMNFNLGNAVKYVTRAPFKENQIQDLEKAAWYIQREIDRLKADE